MKKAAGILETLDRLTSGSEKDRNAVTSIQGTRRRILRFFMVSSVAAKSRVV